jgi:hypothetical protein
MMESMTPFGVNMELLKRYQSFRELHSISSPTGLSMITIRPLTTKLGRFMIAMTSATGHSQCTLIRSIALAGF